MQFVQASPSHTLRSVAHSQLTALGCALRLDPGRTSRVQGILDTLAHPWSGLALGDEAPWANDIGDDATPFEYSVAFVGERADLRLLVEPQREPFTLRSNWDAGMDVLQVLRRDEGADLTNFLRVCRPFEPAPDSVARFAQWHAAVVPPEGPAFFKVYLNPHIHGDSLGPTLIDDALRSLGLQHAASFLRDRAGAGPSGDALYFSVDLLPSDVARTKVYLVGRSAEEVEGQVRGATNFYPGRAAGYLAQLTGSAGPYFERPILTCFSFRKGESAPEATLHVPIRSYVENDEVALARVEPLLVEQTPRLRAAIESIAPGPLVESVGGLAYASLRPGPGRLRVTTYLAPRLFGREKT